MLGQYGLGSSGSYGQHRAPMGFGGGRQYGSTPQPSYGAYTPPQSLGQTPQTQYSSYTPPQSSGLGSQPMGASRAGMVGGGTPAQTLGDGQYYHVQREGDPSNRFMQMERLPGLGDSNVPGYGVNQLTGLLEASPWAPQAPQQEDTSGLGGMTWNPQSQSYGYAGLQAPDSLRGTMQGDAGLSYGPNEALQQHSVFGMANKGLPAGWNPSRPNPYGAVSNASNQFGGLM